MIKISASRTKRAQQIREAQCFKGYVGELDDCLNSIVDDEAWMLLHTNARGQVPVSYSLDPVFSSRCLNMNFRRRRVPGAYRARGSNLAMCPRAGSEDFAASKTVLAAQMDEARLGRLSQACPR